MTLTVRGTIKRHIERQDVHPRLAQEPEGTSLDSLVDQLTYTIFGHVAGFRNTGTWKSAAAGEMSGSRPLAVVVTRSIGTGADGFSCLSLSTSPCTRSIRALLVGPEFRAAGIRRVVGGGTVLVDRSDRVRPWLTDGRGNIGRW